MMSVQFSQLVLILSLVGAGGDDAANDNGGQSENDGDSGVHDDSFLSL